MLSHFGIGTDDSVGVEIGRKESGDGEGVVGECTMEGRSMRNAKVEVVEAKKWSINAQVALLILDAQSG